MKISIPGDWDGHQWACYQLWWPNSTQWRAVLMGLLTTPTRGRFWDERSGVIRDAQQIAWDIFERNMPLSACGDSAEQGEAPSIPLSVSCAACEEGGSEMTGPCLPPIKIEDGFIWWWDKGCCQWVRVGALADSGTPEDAPPDDAYTPPEGPYYACGKAERLVDAVYAVAQAVWDNRASVVLWEFVSDVEDQSRNHHLADGWLWLARLQAIELDIVWTESDVFDARYRQAVKCRLSSLFGDDSSDESDIWHLIVREFNAALPILPPVGLFFHYCLMAIGRTYASRYIVSGAGNAAADCDCNSPSAGPNPPPNVEWSYNFDFTQSPNQFVPSPGGWEWVSGEGWGIPGTTALDNDEIQIGRQVTGTQPRQFSVRYVWVEVALPPQASAPGAASALSGLYWQSSGNPAQVYASSEQIRTDADGRLSWSGEHSVNYLGSGQDEQIRFAVRLLRGPNVEDRFTPHMRVRRLFVAGVGEPPF